MKDSFIAKSRFIVSSAVALCVLAGATALAQSQTNELRVDKPTEIQGLSRQGKVDYFTNYGQRWPAYSRLWPVDKFGRIRFWPAKDMVIQGHVCKKVDDGIGHYLYADGKLCGIWLKQREMIDGLPCTSSGNLITMPLRAALSGTERMAWFYKDGHLKQAMLSRKFTIQGHAFKKGDVVCLGPDGKLDLKAQKPDE